jgi:HEAT repeat protein
VNSELQNVLIQFKSANLQESIQASHDLMRFGEISVEPLISIIQDANQSHLWWLAADTLGYIGDKRAFEPLIELLKNPLSHQSRLARKYTAYALARLPDRQAIDVLIEMLHDPAFQDEYEDDEIYVEQEQYDAETIEAAVGALASIGEWRGTLAVIERFLEGDFWCDCRMGEWGGEQAFQYLIAQAKSDDPNRRSRAASLLGEFGDKRAVSLLIELMKADSSDKVRSSAAYGLSILGDPRAFIPSIRALGDSYEQVRLHAMETIRYFLIGLYQPTSEQPDVKTIFDEAVSELEEQTIVDVLMNAAMDSFVSLRAIEYIPLWSPFVRQEIIQQRIIPQLRILTTNSDSRIGDAASAALKQISSAES